MLNVYQFRLDERGIPFCVSDTGEVQCPCKENFAGEFCDRCAPGYYNFPECKRKLCFCNSEIHISMNLTLIPWTAWKSLFDKNLVFILACECNAIGINNDTCDAVTGQCDCKTNYGQRQCDACADGYFSFPTCSGRNYW